MYPEVPQRFVPGDILPPHEVCSSVAVGGSCLLGGSVFCETMHSVTMWTYLKGHVSFCDIVAVTGQPKLS